MKESQKQQEQIFIQKTKKKFKGRKCTYPVSYYKQKEHSCAVKHKVFQACCIKLESMFSLKCC